MLKSKHLLALQLADGQWCTPTLESFQMRRWLNIIPWGYEFYNSDFQTMSLVFKRIAQKAGAPLVPDSLRRLHSSYSPRQDCRLFFITARSEAEETQRGFFLPINSNRTEPRIRVMYHLLRHHRQIAA